MGDLRPVIDLSTLNKSLVVPHFQMETAQTVRAAIHRQEWTVLIDIRDAYLHVPMNQKISQFPCQQQDVSIYMSPVGTGHLSKEIHQDPASSCPVPSNARGSASCVFVRLADPGEFARDSEFPCTASDDSAAPSRMDHKSGEVRTDTQTRVRFHEDEIQNAGFHGSSPAENASQGSVHNRSLASGSIDIGAGYAQNARKNSVHGTIGSKRAATFPSDSMVGH